MHVLLCYWHGEPSTRASFTGDICYSTQCVVAIPNSSANALTDAKFLPPRPPLAAFFAAVEKHAEKATRGCLDTRLPFYPVHHTCEKIY